MSQPLQPIRPSTLRELLLANLVAYCSKEEIKTLCFILQVDFDSLAGDTKESIARELILLLERLNRVDELVARGKELRPGLAWGMSDGTSALPSVAYGDVMRATTQPVDFIEGLSSADRSVLRQPFRLEFIRVPAGEFLMGSTGADQFALGHEKQQHRIYLNTYWISRHEITVAEFAAFVSATCHRTTAEREGGGYTPCLTPTGDKWLLLRGADWRHPHGPDSNISEKQNHPVTQVSWDDALAFCQWLSRVTSLHVQLPTEAQWEKAARGKDGRIYPWGNEWDAKRLNSNESGIGDTTSVGKYSPAGDSPYGAVDVAGNVWEWTSTLFELYPYQSEDGREDEHSPRDRVMRGGSWKRGSQEARCAHRSGDPPDFRTAFIGFRVAICAESLSPS
jgi:formylglycine-generating enzyme required for sulfatase activity